MNKRRVAFIAVIFVLLALLIVGGFIYAKNISRVSSRKTASKEISQSEAGSRGAGARLSWISLDVPTMVKDSDTIIRGKVTEVLPSIEGPKPKIVLGEKAAEEAKKSGEPFTIVREDISKEELQKLEKRLQGYIFTDKVVKVNKYYKNALQTDTIIVREQGGKIGEREETISGVTPLKTGDEVILFVQRWTIKSFADKYVIMGGPQGKYYIEQDYARNEWPQGTKKLSDLEAEVMSLVNR